MSRIKGRYVAQVILTVDEERTEDMSPIEVIKENFAGITEEIKKELDSGDFTSVEVIEQFSEVDEVEEEHDMLDVISVLGSHRQDSPMRELSDV